MNGRGIVALVAAVALVASGCTSEVDAADELRDIREVLAEAPEQADPESDLDAETEPTNEGSADDQQDEIPSAETPEEGETPSDTTDVDITVVPDEVTVEYVQAVLDELERILAEALVLMMNEGELTVEITDHIGEIFTVEQRNLRTDELVAAAEEDFAGMSDPDSLVPRHREALGIIDQSKDCLYVEALAYEEGLFPNVSEPAVSFVVLRRPTVSRPTDLNPTPWVYASLAVGDPENLKAEQPCQD